MIDYTLPLDQLPDPLPIEPLTKPFDVTITPPGSKSITCRAYVLAALAEGESKIIRPLRADDPDHLLNALCALGAEVRWVKSDEHDGEDVYIKGVGGRFPRGGNLYMGEGGTPTRFMIACACLANEPVTIDASQRMRERPIAEGVDMLRQLGAKIEYVEEEGRLPVRVLPSDTLFGGALTVGMTMSSQFISALLLVSPFLQSGLLVKLSDDVTSSSYIELSTNVLRRFGISVVGTVNDKLSCVGYWVASHTVKGCSFEVQADASSGLYWAVAAQMFPKASVLLKHMSRSSSSNHEDTVQQIDQPDLGAILILMRGDAWNVEQDGSLRISSSDSLQSISLNAERMPDGSLAFAAFAADRRIRSRLTGLRTLRVKETDRIAALANELRKVGCVVNAGEDWIEITPPTHRPPAETGANGDRTPIVIETYNDHRMAMAFAVLGLNPPNGVPLAIRNPKCVAKSYPGFWKDFATLYQ